jgi:hypothetical protein
MLKKRILYLPLIIALFTGRCSYKLEDGGYDLSQFRKNPGLTSVPAELRGVVPTNAEAVQAISARNDGGDLRFVVIGDTISNNNETFRTFIREIADLDPPPAFIVHLGDRVVSPVVDFYGAYFKLIRGLPFPTLHIDGNHDVREEGERISRAFFGERDFYFDRDDIRFVFMGNIRGKRDAGFSPDQLAWLDETLKAPSPSRKFFFAHVPPKAPFKRYNRGISALFTPRLENEEQFLDILTRHNVVLAAFGHRHVHASMVHDGVLMVITGGGGQRNFLEPAVKEPQFTKKKHYTLIDIRPAGPYETFAGTLSCVGQGGETLSVSSFSQASPFTGGEDLSVVFRPYPAGSVGLFWPGYPAAAKPRSSGRTP